MLTFRIEEIEKLISTLRWVQVATLSTEEDQKQMQDLIEKLVVAKKTSHKKKIEIIVE